MENSNEATPLIFVQLKFNWNRVKNSACIESRLIRNTRQIKITTRSSFCLKFNFTKISEIKKPKHMSLTAHKLHKTIFWFLEFFSLTTAQQKLRPLQQKANFRPNFASFSVVLL
jgi:hypothetical protein